MTASPLPSPEELRRRIAAERAGLPFIVYRRADGAQDLFTLRDEAQHATVGRDDRCDVRLELDPEVSRLHAELRHLGGQWVISDDGLSRNGTFVNGERISGRTRLRDGDAVRCGNSLLTFHDPLNPGRPSTHAAAEHREVMLTDTQRRVLIALCRPLRDGDPYAVPASNQAIAEALFLSLGAVKGHLRTLFEKLEVEALPHNQKRLRLVELALQGGLLSTNDLR
ncbi:MAG: FHA domain-containing protein [Solirubrobacteraceae bacterium]